MKCDFCAIYYMLIMFMVKPVLTFGRIEGLTPGGGGGAGLLDRVDFRVPDGDPTAGVLRGDGSGLFRLLLIVFRGFTGTDLQSR